MIVLNFIHLNCCFYFDFLFIYNRDFVKLILQDEKIYFRTHVNFLFVISFAFTYFFFNFFFVFIILRDRNSSFRDDEL